jgi:hypothetical protein
MKLCPPHALINTHVLTGYHVTHSLRANLEGVAEQTVQYTELEVVQHQRDQVVEFQKLQDPPRPLGE